jgi:hypothetical protein
VATVFWEFDDDGQGCRRVYRRNSSNNEWEYLIVRWTDDGEILEAIELIHGKAIDRTKQVCYTHATET